MQEIRPSRRRFGARAGGNAGVSPERSRVTFALDRFDLDRFVAATLAEDLGDDGDITSAAVIPAGCALRRRDGQPRARSSSPASRSPRPSSARSTRDARIERLVEEGAAPTAGTDLMRTRPGARDAHRRAVGAQHRPASLRHRHADPALRRRDRRHRPVLLDTRKTIPGLACSKNMRPAWAARRTTACGSTMRR